MLEQLPVLVLSKLAPVVDVNELDVGAVGGGQDLPRHDVGVVVEDGQHDQVAWPDVLATPRVRDQVDGLGSPARVDDLFGRGCVDERTHLLSRALVPVGRHLRDVVCRAMGVRVEILEVVHHRPGHLARPLRRVRGIQVSDTSLEDGEVLADLGDVEATGYVGGHSGTSTYTSSPCTVTGSVVAGMTAGRPVTLPVTRLKRAPCCGHSTSMSHSSPSLSENSSCVQVSLSA